jgi:hypothetical protein
MRATSISARPRLLGYRLRRYLASWWYMIHLGAVALVMAFSPSTYNRANRLAASRYIYASTWQVLPWFTVLSALVSLVIIRIVLVTAFSYGLSRYALEMVVRVLVLELIPLSAWRARACLPPRPAPKRCASCGATWCRRCSPTPSRCSALPWPAAPSCWCWPT